MRSFALKFKRDSNHRINNLTNQPLYATGHFKDVCTWAFTLQKNIF